MRDWGSDICTDHANVHVHIIIHPDGTDSLEDGMFTIGLQAKILLFVFLWNYAFVAFPHIWKGGNRMDKTLVRPFVTSLILGTKCEIVREDFSRRRREQRRSREWTTLPSLTDRIWIYLQNKIGCREETFKAVEELEMLNKKQKNYYPDHRNHHLQHTLDRQRNVFSMRLRLLRLLKEGFRRTSCQEPSLSRTLPCSDREHPGHPFPLT